MSQRLFDFLLVSITRHSLQIDKSDKCCIIASLGGGNWSLIPEKIREQNNISIYLISLQVEFHVLRSIQNWHPRLKCQDWLPYPAFAIVLNPNTAGNALPWQLLPHRYNLFHLTSWDERWVYNGKFTMEQFQLRKIKLKGSNNKKGKLDH